MFMGLLTLYEKNNTTKMFPKLEAVKNVSNLGICSLIISAAFPHLYSHDRNPEAIGDHTRDEEVGVYYVSWTAQLPGEQKCADV